jgi:hypothetical protein
MSKVRISGVAAHIRWAGVAVSWPQSTGGIRTRHGGH